MYDESDGEHYLHIDPDGNNFTLPSLLLLHQISKSQLINTLYEESSLGNVRTLEIIVFVAILVMSISIYMYSLFHPCPVIFIFVWITARRIGYSFE